MTFSSGMSSGNEETFKGSRYEVKIPRGCNSKVHPGPRLHVLSQVWKIGSISKLFMEGAIQADCGQGCQAIEVGPEDDVASCAAKVELASSKQAAAFILPSLPLMPVTQFNQIKPGLPVSIVLKADQRTGRQVQGTVSQLLTRHNHPRGIKVKLTDGRVGRVQHILRNMGSNNPWADSTSQGNPYQSPEEQQQGLNQTYFAQDASNQHQQTPYGQRPQQAGHGHGGYQQGGYNQGGYQQGGFNAPPGPPPGQGIQRSDTEQLLAQQQDAGAQVETMQQYESNARQTDDDRAQAELQKQFPNIDSSLIAAIYNERKPNMAEVRELLQELNTS